MPDIHSLEARFRKTLSKAKLAPHQLPICPQITLNLFDPSVLEGPIPHDEAQKIVAEPAYWSFCWASGQVLASYILANPDWVKGKRVLDFGSGSGVVAIAAALAGAKEVIACDLDDDALLACQVNATSNNLSLQYSDDFFEVQGDIDLITAADVLYDRDNYPLLDAFKARATAVLLADSRVKVLPSEDYIKRDCIEARTWPDLNEFEEFNQVRIYSVATAG